jgi:hypothetical protein
LAHEGFFPVSRQKDVIMKPQKDQKIEEILQSLDGMGRASAPDFFYTRLQARMEKELVRPVAQKRPLVLRPVFAFAALLIVLLVNAAIIFQGSNNASEEIPEANAYQSIAAEYSLNETISEEVYR